MYESSPLRKLLHGRAETIRSCTEESLVFSKAFSNEDIPAKKKLAYFQQAIATHVELSRPGLRQLDRALTGICLDYQDSRRGREGAWLFQNKACVNSMAFGLSTSNVTPGERFHGGFAPVILDGYGVNYVLDKSDLKFSVSEWLSSPVTDAPAFRQTLHRTLEDLHEAGKYAKTHATPSMADQADVYKYFEPTVQLNNLALSNIHTLASWGVGTAAGILGLTGWNGFIFFVINWIAISALVLFVKCKGDSSVYFKSGLMDVAGTPMFNTLLSYVLVWTLMHALVYIYD